MYRAARAILPDDFQHSQVARSVDLSVEAKIGILLLQLVRYTVYYLASRTLKSEFAQNPGQLTCVSPYNRLFAFSAYQP